MVTCAVPGCGTCKRNNPHNYTFHIFPLNRSLRQKWLKIINRVGWEPRRYSTVCSKHFQPDCFSQKGSHRVRLRLDSVPSLFMPDKSKPKRKVSSYALRDTSSAPVNKPKSLPIKNNQKKKKKKKSHVTMNTEEKNQYADADETDITKYECRCCLQSTEAIHLFNLFQTWSPGWEGMENTIADDLCKLANIQVLENDRFSSFICSDCCEKLQNACQFVSVVRETDRLLWMKWSDTSNEGIDKEWPKPIQIDKSVIPFENSFEVDIKQEVLSGDEYDVNNVNQDNEDNQDNLVNHDNDVNHDIHVNHDSRDEFYKELDKELDLTASLDIKVEPEEIVDPLYTYYSMNGIIKSDIPVQNGITNNVNENSPSEVKEEILTDPEDADLTPSDLSLECMLCARAFNCVTGLKAHVIAQHSYKSVKRKMDSPKIPVRTKHICSFCKRVFSTSTDLMVHETCHNKHLCYGCNAAFDSFEDLTEHTEQCKAMKSNKPKKLKTLDDVQRSQTLSGHTSPSIPDDKMWPCDLCDVSFTDSYYLNIHQAVLHSKVTTEINTECKSPMETESLEKMFSENT